MKAIAAFIRSRSISAHSFVSLYGLWTLYLMADKAARTTVFGFLDKHPFYSIGAGFLAFVYSRYAGAHSDSGIMAEADKVITTAAVADQTAVRKS